MPFRLIQLRLLDFEQLPDANSHRPCWSDSRHRKRVQQVTEFSLRLYIAGDSTTSRRARQHLARIQDHLKQHKFDVETIDVLAQPQIAEQEKILATPTLAFEHAGRPKRIVGDLSDTSRVIEFLGIQLKDGKA